MGWLDNLFKGKTQSSKKEFEAKRANVLARCYKTKEQLASEERLSYDDKDKQAFEDWIDGKAGFFLQSLSYPKSILQKLNDDITLDDIPYLSDVEKSVLEGLKKKVDSGDFDFYDLSRIMQNKTLFDDELFEALTTKIAVNNLPDESVTYRYLEKAGYSKDEAFDIINLFNNSDTISKLYNNPNTPDIFPNGRNEIEIYLENKVRDVSSAYASARLVKSVLANCPDLQNNGLAQYIEEKFTEYDEILTKHDFAIQNLEEINPYIDLLDVSSVESRVPDIHATIKSAVTRLFEEKPDYSFPIFNYGQLNSYMSRHTENFFDLPETLFNKIINNSAQKDISFFDAAVNSLGERQGHYLSFKYGTIGDGYYNDDLDYANIKLLLDKGYGSEGARAALLERIAKIEEAFPSVIEVYKEKYGAYLTPAANEDEKQQDAENQTPHILHDNLIGDYIRKEDWISHHTTSEGKKIGEIFYLSEDGREYAAVQDAGIIKIATFYTEKGRSEEYRYYDGKLSSKTKFYEDGGEDQETFNKETGKRETLEIRRVPEKRKGTDDTRWTLKDYTRYLEDGETVKKREIYDIESDSHITLYNEEYDADTQKRTITEYQDQKPSRIVTYKNDKQIRVEKYENGKLSEVYQSADEQSDAYGPGRTFEAYSKEGILESICRYDGDTPAETTFYEKDGKTVSKIEHRYKDRREARTDQYAGGKLADVIFYDGEGNPLPKDALLEDVRNHVIETQTASTSAIQQKYAIGYNRASRLMEVLEAYGVVGPYQDGKREVLASSLSDIHETIPAENAEDKQPTHSPEEKTQEQVLDSINEVPAETPVQTQVPENEGADEEKAEQTLDGRTDEAAVEMPAKEDKNEPLESEDVPFVPYDMAEREAYITEGLAEFENKLEANGVPERLRKAQRKSEKKNLAQVYAFDYVDEKIGEYNEISTPDLVKVLEDLTVQENNEKLDDEDLKDFINDLVSESQWRIDEFVKDEDKSQYSAAELKALQELSTFNATLYKGKIEEQNKAKFDAFTQAENVLAEELGLRLAAGETLDSNVNHETGGDAGKEAIVNPVSQNEDIEKVDDAAKAAAEAARVAKEKEEQKKQQEAEKVRLEQEELKKEQAEKARQEQERKAAEEAKRKQKEDEESQQKPNEGDTPKPNPHQKWEEKLKTVKEKGDIHTLLAFAAEVMQNESDFKDYKYKGAKNEKINAFAWLSENIDRKSLPKHNFESITPSEIDILQNLAQARIDEFRFTSKNNYSLIGVQAKKEGNVFVDLLLDEAKSFTKNKNKIIGNAKNEEQKKELLEKLKKWQELYQSKLHKKVYILDENNRVEDLLKLLEEEIGKLQQSLENTGHQHNDDNGRPDDATSNGDEGRIDDDGENKDDDAVSINVGGEDLKPDDAGGSGEDEGEAGGDDGNDDDTPDDAEPIIELDDFDELVVNHAAEPEITPSTETLADLLEQKLDNKQIFNKRDDNNFALFAQEEDKNTPEKATGRVSVAGNKNIDIISRNLDVYKAAVEAAKAKGAKKIAITSNNADGSPRDLSDSDAGKKNREALAHLFLACAKSGLEAQTTPEIETALQAYPEYQTYQLAKAKDEAYTELSLKLSRMSPAQQDEYKQKKDNFKNAPDDVSKRAAQADLLRFETNNGISALKQKVKDATLAQYNYYIENGNEYGAPTDDASKANRKMQIKDAYDKYQNRGDRYQDADDGSEIKGTRALEIAMYKRLINETTL